MGIPHSKSLVLFTFLLFFQSSEAKEKENATLPVKKGAGKGKTAKVKQETLPTPQGRRVIPRVTSTMKAEANRKADLKKGEGKRGKKIKVCRCFFHHFPLLLPSQMNKHLTGCHLYNRVRVWWWWWSLMKQRVTCPVRMLAWLDDWARKLKPRQRKEVKLGENSHSLKSCRFTDVYPGFRTKRWSSSTPLKSSGFFAAATAKTAKQSTLQFKAVAKKPKKSPSSEDEPDQSGSEEEEVVAPRERIGRRVKGGWSSLKPSATISAHTVWEKAALDVKLSNSANSVL